LEEKLALKIANGFGSGMGRLCRVCGSLTGGFMVIGLKYGRWEEGPQHSADTEETYRLVRLLAERFETRNGSILCRELLGLDLNDPNQRQFATDQGLFKTKCTGYIRDVIEILEDII
jgi:C_GCAxxG_C_C family probable redox protein